ncbi:hypothetical protein ID866_5759 [Astraeus odoratus]|nr:hypothetical protein ID866_5759 [Astraeus odoratus]
MQQAVRQHFPDAEAVYKFTHRDKDVFFSRTCVEAFESSLASFEEVSLTSDEKAWLASKCPYFKPDYLDYLEQYRFKPEQVSVKFIPVSPDGRFGNIEIEATGLWMDAILWEVPMMACLSELHFRLDATDWSYDNQEHVLRQEIQLNPYGDNCSRVVYGREHIIHAGSLRAMGIDIIQVAALEGYDNANLRALQLWEQTYPDVLLTALTDTFSTQTFFKEFVQNPERVRKWTGLRQDSGNPLAFAPAAKAMYESVGVDYRAKNIIYSDAVTLEKALELKQQCDEMGFTCSFGIGTFLTNDFRTKSSSYREKSKALNMVIKLNSINGRPCVKISDDLEKNTGDAATVEFVKKKYGLLA